MHMHFKVNKVLIHKKFDKFKFLLHITKLLFENVTICILLPEFAGIVFRVSFNFILVTSVIVYV